MENTASGAANLAMLIAGLLLPVGLWPAVQAAEATAASAADTNLWGQPAVLPADWHLSWPHQSYHALMPS